MMVTVTDRDSHRLERVGDSDSESAMTYPGIRVGRDSNGRTLKTLN